MLSLLLQCVHTEDAFLLQANPLILYSIINACLQFSVTTSGESVNLH